MPIVRRFSIYSVRNAAPFVALLTFLALVAMTGGGARGDIQSLVILRPAAVLYLGYALWGLTSAQVRSNGFLFAMALAIGALIAAHLVPLPTGIWMSLPGRELAADVDRAAGIVHVWRPISLAPPETINALLSLVVPVAALALAARLDREGRFYILPGLIVFGVFSGLWGFLQAIGPSDGPLYLYQVTNLGSAVGLFANRNHQAVLLACLIPMLAVYASTGIRSVEQLRFRRFIAVGLGVILVPLLLVTGSRAGVIVGVAGLMSVPFLYHRPESLKPPKRKAHKFDVRYAWLAIGVVALALLSIVLSRAEAIHRLLGGGDAEEVRFEIWGPVLDMGRTYFPVGSGLGTFVPAYQVGERTSNLNWYYMNHAHNEWLEIFMTGGLPALILLLIAIIAWASATFRWFRTPLRMGRDVAFGRLGCILIFMLALASSVDYPLRVPSLACLFVVAALWAAGGGTRVETHDSGKSAGTA